MVNIIGRQVNSWEYSCYVTKRYTILISYSYLMHHYSSCILGGSCILEDYNALIITTFITTFYYRITTLLLLLYHFPFTLYNLDKTTIIRYLMVPL